MNSVVDSLNSEFSRDVMMSQNDEPECIDKSSKPLESPENCRRFIVVNVEVSISKSPE